MGIIRDVIVSTETILNGYTETVFVKLAAPLQPVLIAAGTLSVMFIALNQIFNFRSVPYSTYFVWAVRYICILSIVLVWGNFEHFYNLFIALPFGYAGSLISAASLGSQLELCVPKGGLFGFGLTSLPTVVDIGSQVGLDGDCSKIAPPPAVTGGDSSVFDALDYFSDTIKAIAGAVMAQFVLLDGSTYKYILAGLIIHIIGLIFTAAAVIIMLVAKLGFTLMMSMAPLAIAMLTFNETRSYFESWLRLTSGFAVVPLLTSSLMSVIILVAFNLQREDDFFGGYMPFMLVALGAMVLMFQIPVLASQLATTNVPQLGPAAAKQAVLRIAQVISAPARLANSVGNRTSGASNAAKSAKARGASNAGAAFAAAKAMTQSAKYRSERSDRASYQRKALARARKK